MIRLSRSAILAILIAAVPTCALHATGAPGPHAWSQYAIARALLSEEVGLDPAARLTVAQSYDEALGALGRSTDSLRAGILACKAEKYSAAIDLLRCHVDNPYLEWLRLYDYAAALCAEKRYRESESALDTLFSMNAAGAFGRSWPMTHEARDLSVELIAASDSLLRVKGIPEDVPSLSNRSLILLSEALLDRGRDTTVVAIWERKAAGRWWHRLDSPAGPLFPKFLGKLQALYPRLSSKCLRVFAEEAIGMGLDKEAGKIIRSMLQRNAGDYDALLCRGTLYESTNRARKAMVQYDEILRSAAPLPIRKEALVRSASLEYKLKNYERAAEKYCSYMKRYPSDPNGRLYLELAVRIDIFLGKYDAALSLLKSHRPPLHDGAAVFPVDPERSVCEAALRFSTGDSAGAHELLKQTVQESWPVDERDAYFYWLSRTSPRDSERVSWEAKLVAQDPSSFYAADLEGGINALISRDDVETRRARIWAMLRSERRLIDSLSAQVPPDDSLLHESAFEAFIYLLDRGFLPEAYVCLSEVRPMARGSEARSFIVYRAARERGLYWLSLRVVDALGCIDDSIRARLQYPVAFADILAKEGATAGLPPECILGVMREESAFDPCATSSDGALGLMQLMPATARWMARRSPGTGARQDDLFDAARNIEIGSAYLDYLLERFNGSLVGALAAYNGGEGKMASWNKAFDPCRDPMLAIEMIGPSETRAYVKKVLASICVYRSLLEKETESR